MIRATQVISGRTRFQRLWEIFGFTGNQNVIYVLKKGSLI